jgi:hypothetical protein
MVVAMVVPAMDALEGVGQPVTLMYSEATAEYDVVISPAASKRLPVADATLKTNT